MSNTVEVILNGEPASFEATATVADAVERAGVEQDARGVAVAVDGEVVTRAGWESTPLVTGQAIEVVRAIQGGCR
jgi:sulfur carrier protein